MTIVFFCELINGECLNTVILYVNRSFLPDKIIINIRVTYSLSKIRQLMTPTMFFLYMYMILLLYIILYYIVLYAYDTKAQG